MRRSTDRLARGRLPGGRLPPVPTPVRLAVLRQTQVRPWAAGTAEVNRVLHLRRALASHGYDLDLRLAAVVDDLIDNALAG